MQPKDPFAVVRVTPIKSLIHNVWVGLVFVSTIVVSHLHVLSWCVQTNNFITNKLRWRHGNGVIRNLCIEVILGIMLIFASSVQYHQQFWNDLGIIMLEPLHRENSGKLCYNRLGCLGFRNRLAEASVQRPWPKQTVIQNSVFFRDEPRTFNSHRNIDLWEQQSPWKENQTMKGNGRRELGGTKLFVLLTFFLGPFTDKICVPLENLAWFPNITNYYHLFYLIHRKYIFAQRMGKITDREVEPFFHNHPREQRFSHVKRVTLEEYQGVEHLKGIVALQSFRFGEAKNPGPDTSNCSKGLLAIGSINPTAITSKLDVLHGLGPCIWSMSETSATYRQQQIAKAYFKKQSWHTVFGRPVRAHKNGLMALRGVAQGVGVVSSFPSWKAIAPLSEELELSCRILISFTQISPNLTLQMVTIYGPHTKAMVSPLAFLDKLMRTALERARSYNGPTIILGDLNYNLEDIPSWNLIQQCGYSDAAVLDAQTRNSFPSPTCKGLSRKTFLIPQSMQPALVHCDTLEDYLFDTHPVLRALFRVDILTQARVQINLPKTLDDFLFDEHELIASSTRVCSQYNELFEKCIHEHRMDELATTWATMAENTLCSSVVDVEGNRVHVGRGFRGRSDPELVHKTPPSMPIPKPGRDGDFEPSGEFHSVRLRQWLRQVRRLQTMEANRKALDKSTEEKRSWILTKCNELWRAILKAKGFPGGFLAFIQDTFPVLPLGCPPLPFISALKDYMMEIYHKEERNIMTKCQKKKSDDIRHDMAQKGGRMAYTMLREHDKNISPVFQQRINVRITPQRIHAKGQHVLFVHDAAQLDPKTPLIYGTQCVKIKHIESNKLYLDQPIFLKHDEHEAYQIHTTVQDEEKADMALAFWNRCWKRDDPDENEQIQASAQQIIDSIPPWLSFNGTQTTLGHLKDALRGTKKRNMRGSCKFSTVELQKLPDDLMEKLVRILRLVENGTCWPTQWMTAFVIFLPKVEDSHKPSDLRPITVISKIYRLWARMHALQVITWASANVAPLIGGGVREVNPNEIMTFVQLAIETHQTDSTHLQGLVLDIQKAFNNLHRGLLDAIFEKLGLPQWLRQPYNQMMLQLERRLVFASHISKGAKSTCGVPEGCPIAVLAMLAYTVGLYSWLQAQKPEVTFYGFADNWSVYHNQVKVLKEAIQDIENFCNIMKLPLAGDKSWTWSTDAKGRQLMKGIHLQGKEVPLRLNEKELGCDMQYTRKASRSVFKQRMASAISKLRKIPKIPVQKKFKKRLIQGSALPTCQYGANLIHGSRQEMQRGVEQVNHHTCVASLAISITLIPN